MASGIMKRRSFLQQTAAAAAGLSLFPYTFAKTGSVQEPLMKRSFGKIGREVTTFGLGGQASLQWTPEDVDPVAIILKAFHRGVTYFDTSNLYGPSQGNYGKAFNSLGLIPDGRGTKKNSGSRYS